MLVRIKGKAPADKDQRQWLLFKERDKEAKAADKFDVLEKSPHSVSTGRSLEDIAADRDWVWGAKRKPKSRLRSKAAVPASAAESAKAL